MKATASSTNMIRKSTIKRDYYANSTISKHKRPFLFRQCKCKTTISTNQFLGVEPTKLVSEATKKFYYISILQYS